MSMYLPNSDLRPTGAEAAEFLDVPPMAEMSSVADATVERREGTTVRLDTQTRLNITRRVEEYIVGLVEDHNGDPEDVRSIIREVHELHDQRALTYHDGRAIKGNSSFAKRPE
ncbi:MAG TPA: hypothetical protein VJM49_02425 [Acidimicrobiales bacterium]|nr:hypothetical protein [Acidimicrobiales bacterium]